VFTSKMGVHRCWAQRLSLVEPTIMIGLITQMKIESIKMLHISISDMSWSRRYLNWNNAIQSTRCIVEHQVLVYRFSHEIYIDTMIIQMLKCTIWIMLVLFVIKRIWFQFFTVNYSHSLNTKLSAIHILVNKSVKNVTTVYLAALLGYRQEISRYLFFLLNVWIME
jgi:hypothetical protein